MQGRRRVLVAATLLAPALLRAQPPAAAFNAKSLAEVLKALDAGPGEPSPQVQLRAPDLQENGAAVEFTASATAAGVRRLAIVVEKNPTALAAVYEFAEPVAPSVRAHYKMQQTSKVYAVALTADRRALYAVREVKVTIGGCGVMEVEPTQPGPSLIRAQAQGGQALVRVRAQHEMESGQRRDAAGKPVPAWHIEELVVRHNGRPALTARLGTAVSRNPFLEFSLRGAKAGDRIAIDWKDNRGQRRSDEATIG